MALRKALERLDMLAMRGFDPAACEEADELGAGSLERKDLCGDHPRLAIGDASDDDVERKAVLAPTGVDADATGEAEVEFRKDAPANQEVEFSIRNVSLDATFTFVIDGTAVATATANARGRA